MEPQLLATHPIRKKIKWALLSILYFLAVLGSVKQSLWTSEARFPYEISLKTFMEPYRQYNGNQLFNNKRKLFFCISDAFRWIKPFSEKKFQKRLDFKTAKVFFHMTRVSL